MNNHCQICEGVFTSNKKYMSKPIMSNHGFTRPGDGCLHGSCFGARKHPYEISCDAIQPYIDMVSQWREGRIKFLQNFKKNPPATLTRTPPYLGAETKTYERPEGFSTEENEKKGSFGFADGYAYEHHHTVYEVTKSIVNAAREVKRMQKRLAAWKPLA